MPKITDKLTKLSLLYESAISLKNHEGDLIWSRFSGFILANTILFILIGELLKKDIRLIYIPIISGTGIILNLLWLLSMKRGFEAIDYWSCSIREIEEKILEGDSIPSLYIRGDKYFKQNREVRFDIGKGKYLQRGCLTRCTHLDTKGTAYISIILILVIYLAIFISYFLGWLPSLNNLVFLEVNGVT